MNSFTCVITQVAETNEKTEEESEKKTEEEGEMRRGSMALASPTEIRGNVPQGTWALQGRT